MNGIATGTFEVKLTPQASLEPTADPGLGRLTIDKAFRGDLEGTSQGLMLSAAGSVKGSAGYVAIERIHGTLKGQSGSFVLQHSGTTTRGQGEVSVTVVPDSGTDQLSELVGRMSINKDGGAHTYRFEYTLPD